MFLKWFVANLAPTGSRSTQLLRLGLGLPRLAFLLAISVITIIGWAWVDAAWMRWICRNIERHAARSHLQRQRPGGAVATIVLAIACVFIIPIPWVYRWYAQLVRVADSRWPSAAR